MSVIIGYTPDGQPITIGDEERRSGLYVLGKSGTGKSTLLTNMIAQDITNGHGVFFLDPHGEAINDILLRLDLNFLKWRAYILDPEDEHFSFGINLLACQNIHSLKARTETYTRAYDVFIKLWEDKEQEWGVWLQPIVQNILYVFIENQDYTMAEMPLFLRDKTFRNMLLANMQYNPRVVEYWKHEYSERQAQPFITRLRMLLSHPYVDHIICQKKTTINFQEIMSSGNLILVKLSVNLPADIKKFIGTILLSELTHAALTREDRAHFCIYVDEVQNFATSEDFATLFTQARKFHIATTISHQERYGQFADNKKMQGATAAAVNKIFFQTTVRDAQEQAPEFSDVVMATEMRREAELVISPHAVEDIWDKGHPNKWIMNFRSQYFWLVNLLRTNPQEKYFQFDPAQVHQTDLDLDSKPPSYSEYQDWEQYRSSAEMLRQGISLLNTYYYDNMQHSYNRAKLVTEKELGIILKVVECFTGVFGFRPTMEPYIPDEMRQLFVRRQKENQQRAMADFTNEYRRTHSSRSADEQWLETLLKNNFPSTTTVDDIPSSLTSAYVQKWRNFAINLGFTQAELKDFIQWRPRILNSLEAARLTDIITLIANMSVDKEEYDRTNRKIIDKYGSIMIYQAIGGDIEEFERKLTVLENDSQWRNHPIRRRIVWQTTELQYFIYKCFQFAGGILEKEPIKVSSGKYDESVKMERMQADLVNETAQKLLSLPRYSAYVKIAAKHQGEEIVLKRKIKTCSLSETSRMKEIIDTLPRLNSREAGYIKLRDQIEEEARARQTAWRDSPQDPPSHLDDPPLTSA